MSGPLARRLIVRAESLLGSEAGGLSPSIAPGPGVVDGAATAKPAISMEASDGSVRRGYALATSIQLI